MLQETGIERYVNEVQDRFLCKKRIRIGMEIAILVVTVVMIFSLKSVMYEKELQVGIADKILRFHILANSDTEEDQGLKLKVKKEVVEYLQEQLKEVTNKEDAKQVMESHMDEIQQVAINKIYEEGYCYPVKVEIGRTYFPTKVYGDLTFPEGEYEALRVLIGKAEGKNWWCVLFPSLCMVNETYSVVPEESKDTLKYVLSEEEYETLEPKATPENNKEEKATKIEEKDTPQESKENTVEGGKIQYRFAILESVSHFFNRFFR